LKVVPIYIQVSSLHKGDTSESIQQIFLRKSKILISKIIFK